MEEKDDDIKRAIDDIFGDDVIEIDTSNDDLNKNFNDEDEFSNVAKTSMENINSLSNTNDNDSNESINNLNDINPNNLNDSVNTLDGMNADEVNNDFDEEEYLKEDFVSKEKKQSKPFDIKTLIYFTLGFLVLIIVIYAAINYANKREKIIKCSYEAEDVGYKVTDWYKIKYKNNDILYVEGEYNYIAKTNEYKGQIPYIKNEKIPVIINSNGMKGFTYVYETNESLFKVLTYLDYELFDYDRISNIDQSVFPISYFKINTNRSLSDLIKDLERKDYVCTKSK